MSWRPIDLIFRAAWLFYMKDLRQDDIASRMKVSRASVNAYIKKARQTGMVHISMEPRGFREQQLAVDLEERFGLEAAYVIPADENGRCARKDLLEVASTVVHQCLEDGDVFGVAWGKTLYEFSDILRPALYRNLTVIQLCGNLGAPYGYAPEECTSKIARQLGAASRNLYAPLVLSTAGLAERLRKEPIIAEQMSAMEKCTKALFSIGSCRPDSHIVTCGAMSAKQLRNHRAAGARAVIAGRLIDRFGKAMDTQDDRTIAISLHSLLKIPLRLAVVHGADKAEATHAALRGSIMSHLVIDENCANAILEDTGSSQVVTALSKKRSPARHK